MSMRETYQRTLTRALLIAGDEVALASRLQVPVHSLINWLLGDAPVPAPVFLRAVDVLGEANRPLVANDEEILAALRKRHRGG